MSDSDSEAESLYFTPPSSLRGDEVFDDTGLDEDSKNAILMEAIEEQDKKRALSVLVGSNKWIVELKIWYLRQRHKVLKLKKETNQESQDTEEEDSLEEISFLEDCLHQFQERLITANASTATKHRVTPRKVGTTFKQLYQFKLPKEFVAKPIIASSTEAEFTLHANDQSLHYDSFSSCFHQLMSQKYGHLDELDLFGDTKGDDKPGIIAVDFETDLRTCNQAEHYSLFFAKLFSQCKSVKKLQEHFKHWYEDFTIVSSPDHFQQEILNQVLSFCYYLIDSRLQTIEVFEQYESGFHSKMCSYSKFKHTINNSALKSKLNNIARDFEPKLEHLSEIMTIPDRVSAVKTSTKRHALLNVIESLVTIHQECSTETTQEAQVMRESILKVEVELYRKVLEVVNINQKATEQVKQCLEPGFNHFAYLHQHLSNFCELLKTVLHPYTVTPEKKDTHTIYTVTMVVGSVSGALSAFSEWLDSTNREYSLVSGDKLRLCADTVLFLDSDVKHDYLTFQGVSVALIAPKLSHEKGDKICVSTNGKQLDNVSQEKNATSGSCGTKNEKDGQPGKDGDNGLYGNAGGHILIVGSTLHPDKFELSAKASQGQDGQNGGDGGDGWSPPKEFEGKDGSDPEFEPGRLRTEDSVVIQYGTYGQSGGQGGDAGMGGAAGKSGISGKIELIDLEDETNCKTVQEEVEDGKPGEPGKPGKGGRHARHGVDWGKYASALGFGGKIVTFFTTTRPDDSIASVKGELEHSKIEKRPGSGEKIEKKGAKGLPRQRKQEDHPDFKDRGGNRDGKAAQVKVNTAVAKENKAIDKNACLMAMIVLCRQTRNHWNDKAHHNFLKSFANKIDTSYEGRYVTLTRSERIKAGRDMWVDCILKLSGKTEVSVAYSREQTQRASVQVMKNFEAETRVSFSRSISYLSSERDIDVQNAYIDISAFKDRAEEKEVECNDLSLESILTADKYDNYMEQFLMNLGLSESYIHIVVVADSEKAKEFACKYDFLIVNNKADRRWSLYHTRGRATVNVYDDSLIDLLDGIDGLVENETVSMETAVYAYEDVMEWISTTLHKVGAESSVVLPCTFDQIHCVRQFNLVISIKRSYKALYRMCEEKLIHLFQSIYAKFLYLVLESDSSLVLSLKSCQDNLQRAQKYFIMPIDISWLDGNTARISQQATKKLKTACENFNKEYTLKGLLAVINAFVYYDTTCCASAKEEYSNFLSKQKTVLSLKTFMTQLVSTLELFGTQSIEIPDQDFELSTIQEILQRVAICIPSHKQSKVKEYTAVELSFRGVVTIPQSSIAYRVIGSTLTDLSTKMHQLWNLSLPSQVSEVTLLRSKESFKQKCNIFRANPSMKELPEVILSYLDLKPLLSDCKDDIEYLLMYAFDQIHACLVDIKQKELQPSVTAFLESSVTELKCLEQGIKAIPEAVTQAQTLGCLLEQLYALLLKSQKATEEQLLDPATLLITISKMLPEMFDYYRSLVYLSRQEKEKERQTALKWIPIDAERIRALTATLLHYPMVCPTITLQSWDKFVKEKVLIILTVKPKLYEGKKDEEDMKIHQDLVTLLSELNKCSESLSQLVELRQSLDLAVFAKDLNMYTLLCSENDKKRAIMQTCLGLDESLIRAGYLEHFSEWLQPGLLGLSMGELTVSMERQSPEQELLVLSKEPKDIPEDTIVLLATDNGGWKTCCKDTTPAHVQTHQYCDIPPKVLNDILDTLEIDKVADVREVEVSVEKKAEVLRKLLEFERESDKESVFPQKDLLVLSEEPEEIPENTLLLTKNDGTWQLCSKNITPIPNQSFQYRDVVPPGIINDILGIDAHRRVIDDGEIELSIEKKAKILGKLDFEQEFSITCNVQFCGQTIINEAHCKFLLAEIDLTSNEILLEREQQPKKDFANDKVILLFCHSSQLEAVKLPYLQVKQKELYSKRESFLCIVRHPSQPAIIKSVPNCGDQVSLKFSYSTPLATIHQSVTSSTFIKQVRPVVSLLNRYRDLYQSHLPINVLQEKLVDSLKHCAETLFEKEIPKLVKTIQQNFLKSLLNSNATIEDDLGNLTRILEVKEEIFKSKDKIFIKGLLLTGLELFLCFILVKKAKLVDSPKDTDIYRFHQYWQYIFRGKSLSKSEAENLLTAFAYIRESQTVDEGLSQESAAVRSQAYTMIIRGLQLFEFQVHRDTSLEDLTKQLCDKASNFMEMVKIEIIWDCSKKLKKDDRCLPSLFSMIHSLEPLAVEVMQLRSLHAVEANEEKCRQCLESPSFFVDITDIVLFWCTNQMHHFFQEFQLGLVSSQAFRGLTPEGNKIETAVHTFTSWAMSGLEAAFTRNDWESIHQHIKIAGILAMEVSVLVQKGEYPDSVLYLSTVIRTIRMSDNLEDTNYILENFPNDQWLKYLIVSNFLFVLDSYYSTNIDDSLHDQLVHSETKLLQIFYNVFVNDQYNQTSDSPCEDLAGFISLEQVSVILNWLHLIEPCPNANTVLCRTSLALWEKELIEIYFKQYIEHWTDITEADKQKTVYLMKRVRLDTGINHSDFIALLCTVRRKYIESASKNSAGFLEMFEDLYYGRISLEQVRAMVFGHTYNQWKEQLEATKRKKREKCEPRTVSDVLDLIEIQVKSGDYDIATEQFELIKREASDIVSLIHQKVDAVTIDQLDEEFFGLLRRNGTIEEKMEWLVDKDHRVKFVANIVIVLILFTSETPRQKIVPYNSQIVSLLLFLHARNDKGLLQQVKTGEGKTLIVAMLAAAKALLGYHVDIVSSNRDLAQDGMRKCQPFFECLGLQAAVNCTEDDDTNQQAYKSHIVYGDVGSFQRDVLTEECEPGGTSFSARYADLSKNCLIVDEVDSMFLDKGQHMLYLSHETAALKHLETLFIMIWSAVLSISQENELLVGQVLSQLEHKLGVLIDNGTITIPDYLMDFCKKKLSSWIRSAYEACFMDANDQFIIDSKDSHVKQIFPIDKQTGIEQYNMKWTDGLSQFLELKYQRPLSTESLRAVFISNKRFFKRYDKQLFGLTGTLGSLSSRSLLQNVYSIKSVEIPTNRPKRYIQTKSRVATNSKMWCEQVKMEVLDIITEQPVLVICNNIKQLNSVKKYLKADLRLEIVESGDDRQMNPSFGTKLTIEIIDYARDGDDVENRFDKQGALPGQLILATNKGGRGTDIKIDEGKVPKGLHVIVSFLPENTRIEEQAFGRAARAGQAGSGCLIIQINQRECQQTLRTFETVEAATETLVEIEKIKRNRAETERLTILLVQGIPKLDMEEQLYTSFQEHKKALTSVLDEAKLFEVHVKATKHIKKACQTIVTNQWAFWLESVRAQIRSADDLDKRQAIVEMFNEEFPCKDLSLPSSEPDSTLFRMPEDYIQLGQAYLKEIQYLIKQSKADKDTIRSLHKAALTCFERAYDRGDKTGLAAMAACYCFVQLNPEASKDNKKKVRLYLKQARSQLITLKQGWMGNIEVSKALSDLVDVSQYVEKSENHYALQIEGKLKVIGLHLHTIEILLGRPVEESSFVNESSLKVEMISVEQSTELYHIFCSEGIICHNKVRSCWKKREKLESLITKDVEPTIAEGLIELILEKTDVHEDDLSHLVYSSEELWDILEPLLGPSQVCLVFKVQQIVEKLSDNEDLLSNWRVILNQICDGSSECTQCVLPADHPVYKGLQSEEYKNLISFLQSNGLCIDTRRGELKDDASAQISTIDLGKFEKCRISDEHGEEQSLCEFLAGLISHCVEEEDGYLYEYMLPYGNKSQEAKKIHAFLHECDILKSGGLAVCVYDSENAKFESLVEKTLGTGYTKEQSNFILNVLRGLKGEVRKFERNMQIAFVSFYDLKDHPEDIPEELNFFKTWHMDHFLSLEQKDKGWWDWNAFACAMLGLAQVVAGVALVPLTAGLASHISAGLITEGINDMVYATMAGLTGTFSWKDYAIQKAISVAITIATGGLGALATPLKVAAKVGSAARFSAFVKTAAKAAGVFAMGVTTGILSDVVLADVQRRVVDAIVEYSVKKMFPLLREKLRAKLMEMAKEAENDDDFCSKTQRIISDLDLERSKYTLVFDDLRSQIVSFLTQHCRGIADNLSQSNSKWAKLVGTGAKAAFFVDKIFTMVQEGVSLGQTAIKLVTILNTKEALSSVLPWKFRGEELRREEDINQSIFNQELDRIEECFKEFIRKQLQERIRKALNIAIRKSLKLIAVATKSLVRTSVEKAFNGMTTADLVKDMKENAKTEMTVIGEHENEAIQDALTSANFGAERTAPEGANESKQRAFIKKRDDFQETIVEPCRKQQQHQPTTTTSKPNVGIIVDKIHDKQGEASITNQVISKPVNRSLRRAKSVNCKCKGRTKRQVMYVAVQISQSHQGRNVSASASAGYYSKRRVSCRRIN